MNTLQSHPHESACDVYARRLAARLDDSTGELPHDISERLRAARVQALAQEHGFAMNRQASGLRRQRSGLIGMVIPTHEDRFFGALSQSFERHAHEREAAQLARRCDQ